MFESIDLSEATLPKQFGMGCLIVKGGHLWPVSYFVWESSPANVGATFFGEEEAANLLRIEVFKLPKTRDQFDERMEWYSRSRKVRRIKITGGDLFDKDMLHVKSLPKDWERDSFAISKAEIIQTYHSKKFAIIFRFLSRAHDLLEHPLFQRVVKNVRVDEKSWELSPPEIVDATPKARRTIDAPLTDQGEQEVREAVGSVIKRLKLAKVKSPQDRLEAIHRQIELARAEQLDEEQMVPLAIELGCFVGQLFCWALDWEWRLVREPDGTETEAVCSKNRALVIDPITWIYELIADRQRPINCLLLFNMIEAGRLPPTRPRGYAWLG